jgi:hypothetical protein
MSARRIAVAFNRDSVRICRYSFPIRFLILSASFAADDDRLLAHR